MRRTVTHRWGQILAVVLIALLLASCTRTSPLHQAASIGDVARIEEYIAKGEPVNAKDDQGNTPLHYAYYHGHPEAIDRLIAYGADLNIRNQDGDTPLDMAHIAEAEKLIAAGARVLDRDGDWTDRTEGRRIYDELKGKDGTIVTKALVRKVLESNRRLQVLFLAVKLGIPGSEERLNDVLEAYGDQSMAEDYLNSGSSELYAGAERWAQKRGYYIATGMGSHRVGWGRF